MLYSLCTSDSNKAIGEIILDEPPKVGGSVSFAGASWRITGFVWIHNVDNNSMPSGLVCVERGDDGEAKTGGRQ